MGGKLIIQGKAWGEFENAKRSKGNIEISGYRSYGGTHTVRMVDQPQLNENQQIVLDWLKDYYKENRPFTTAFGAIRNVASKRWAFIKQNLTEDQQEKVLQAFSQWALKQEG